MHKCLTTVLAMVLILALALPVFAAGGGTVSPDYINTKKIELTLSFSGSYAQCTVKVFGQSGASVDADIYLDRVYTNGSTYRVATWSNETGSPNLLFYDTRYVLSGYTYRLTVEGTVTRNDVSEDINQSVDVYH